ncbi:hypothetical protein AAF712_015114 [Marasmius tenuissimus]|uniref:Uncharacterized protein n=1 Tax=Marasmius tenuissimus TaxID=585030 RepID=A0ABR2ZBP3_9AGAR
MSLARQKRARETCHSIKHPRYEADCSSPAHERDSDWAQSDDDSILQRRLLSEESGNSSSVRLGHSNSSATPTTRDTECHYSSNPHRVRELEDAVQAQQEYIRELEERVSTLRRGFQEKNDYIDNLEEQPGMYVKDRRLWYQLGATVAAKLDDLGSVLDDAILHGVSNVELPVPPSTS